jgi:signal transduction histidine kinase
VGVEVLNDKERAEDAPVLCFGQGSGLLGLRERVNELGGTMEAGLHPLSGKPYFCLRVELPMQIQMDARAMKEKG